MLGYSSSTGRVAVRAHSSATTVRQECLPSRRRRLLPRTPHLLAQWHPIHSHWSARLQVFLQSQQTPQRQCVQANQELQQQTLLSGPPPTLFHMFLAHRKRGRLGFIDRSQRCRPPLPGSRKRMTIRRAGRAICSPQAVRLLRMEATSCHLE